MPTDRLALRCWFYVRTLVDVGVYRYDRWAVSSSGEPPTGIPFLCAPVIGDHVTLWDDYGHPKVFKVLDRDWAYPSYGSQAWLAGSGDPLTGPMVQIVVEDDGGGIFRDQAPGSGEDDGA
jgi:hypothetical protein